jgi:cytochrome c oxidase subunit 2
MTLVIILILLLLGTLIFHFASPWWFTEVASNWGSIDDTVILTFWVTGIVFIILNVFLIWVVIRYRHREGRKAHYEPENHKLEWWLTIITSIGVVAILAPGLFDWGKVITVPDDAIEVEAVGRQWNWTFRYPGDDGALGKSGVEFISLENPFGIDPEDPAGQDDVVVNSPVMHLPLDQPVKLLLRSIDVLHNFAVPQFRVKMDLVPGLVSYLWLTPTRTGTFEILCEELCGIAHFTMRGKVVVDEATDYADWLDRQPTFAEAASRPAGDAVAGQAGYAVCASCHGAQGEGNPALNAPKLAGQQGWYLKRQLLNYKNGVRGANADDALGQQMAAMATTLIDERAVDNVVAHIGTFPDNPVAATVSGDVERGREIYVNCQVCHGEAGQGRWALRAPRISGASDWYMSRQLENYKSGIRGSHRYDIDGAQMALMAGMLKDDEAINDVLAYINTLQ